MKKFLCALVAVSWLAMSPAQAAPREDVLKLRDDRPKEYVVVKGDTLWDISARFLESPWRWTDVWDMNADIYNPHLIYPGDVIYLVWENGKPVLKVRRGIRKLTPQARVEPLDQAIPAIPLKDILSFLEEARVMDQERYKEAPYILAGKNERLISAAGDRVYARGAPLEELRRQVVYRATNEYIDPDSGEHLGYELTKVSDVTLEDEQGDILSLVVNRSVLETRSLDRVLPAEEHRVQSVFYPQPSPTDLDGKILSVLGAVNDGGQFDVVALNRGLREGLEAGHVFAIYRTGEKLVDPVTKELLQLPSERSGLLMVFKAFEKVSYGLIMQSSNVVSVGDEIREP